MTPQNPNLKMVFASAYLPKYDPNHPLGEDASFISSATQSAGVADGVGGCAAYGIDSGIYARELMRNSAEAFSAGADDPKAALSAGFSESRSEGSSTACLVTLRGGVLRCANVGDSGFLVLRRGAAVARSRPMQKGFNFPVQLGNSGRCARPDCAEETAFPVEAGDLLVLATDGFLDNVFPEEAAEIVHRTVAGPEEVRLDGLAARFMDRAMRNSLDRFRETPFSAAARVAGVPNVFGGKVDDITVVLGLVVSTDSIVG